MTYYESYGPDRTRELRPEPTLHDPVSIVDSELGAWTEVREHARVTESRVGDYSYLMERVQFDYVTIGTFGNVATAARLGPTNHPLDRPSAHHFTYRAAMYDLGDDDESVFDWRAADRVHVGHDVWIGHGAIVLPGVSIGNGAAVGAGAVVTEDVPPYTIVAGVPAQPIRRRFSKETAARIEATEWWTWSHETLRERIGAFRDMETFLTRYAPAADEVISE